MEGMEIDFIEIKGCAIERTKKGSYNVEHPSIGFLGEYPNIEIAFDTAKRPEREQKVFAKIQREWKIERFELFDNLANNFLRISLIFSIGSGAGLLILAKMLIG